MTTSLAARHVHDVVLVHGPALSRATDRLVDDLREAVRRTPGAVLVRCDEERVRRPLVVLRRGDDRLRPVERDLVVADRDLAVVRTRVVRWLMTVPDPEPVRPR